MATWTLSSDAHPIFASKNYINEDTINFGYFTISEMQALFERVLDGDPYSYWQGSSESDATLVGMGFQFMVGSASQRRTFDLLILQNINWKNFLGEYYNPDTNTWATITGTDYQVGIANNAETDLIINIPGGHTALFVRFFVLTTIVANQKKKLGGIIVCAGAVQLSMGFQNYKVRYRESVREMELGDKTLSREYVLRSAADYEFWGASFDAINMTAAELATLRGIKRGGDPFILIPEPGASKRDAYLCHFDGPWGHAYESPNRNLGYEVPMKVKEVGAH